MRVGMYRSGDDKDGKFRVKETTYRIAHYC
jgi:hypothetical protein